MSGDTSGARSLKTAAMVLRALRLLGDHPEGLSASEIGAHLGKSPATARYMVNTLCEAGYARRDDAGRCRLGAAPPWGSWAAAGPPVEPVDVLPGDPAPGAILSEAVTELYRRTRQRAYLVRRTGTLVASVSDDRGHQGLARLPGLGTHVPPAHAHAIAFTKVLLAASSTYREAVLSEPLAALTPSTVVAPEQLDAELTVVAGRGWAVDEQEYARGFATVAAPIMAPSGTSTVAVGLSCSTRRFEAHADELVATVVAVARGAAREWAAAARLDTAHVDGECTCPDCGLEGPAALERDPRRAARPVRRRSQRPTSVMPKARRRR